MKTLNTNAFTYSTKNLIRHGSRGRIFFGLHISFIHLPETNFSNDSINPY